MGFNSGFKGLIQLSSWRWAHSCSKHVEDSNKHIIEEIVRQVGYLPEKVHYNIYIIYSVNLDWIKLFIYDTFDILKSYIASVCFGVIYAIHIELCTKI